MLKKVGRLLIALVILTAGAVIALYIYNDGRTYYNSEDELGNTSGNIYNGGLFCEQDDRIYFSNSQADGALYVMQSDLTGWKRLRDDKAVYINADENYIYYVRANRSGENGREGFMVFYNSGVFRVKQNGTELKAFTGNPGAYLTLKGNSVYFQRYDAGVGLYLYSYQIDGTKERCLIEDAVIPCAVIDDTLYYAGYSGDHNINGLNLHSYTAHPILEGSYLYPIFAGDYIYYMDPSHNYKIFRMNRDGSGITRLVNKRTSTYNITASGKYLYYQIDDAKNNGIHRLNLQTLEDELLMKGDYKNINVTSNYAFYQDFDETNTYVVGADGTAKPRVFTRPEEASDK